MTYRDGFPGLSARSARRGDAGSIAIILVSFLLVAVPETASACIARMGPELGNLDQYETIVIGKVVTVEMLPDHFLARSDLTMPHTIEITVQRTIKGQAAEKMRFEAVTGCGIPVPEPESVGIFFVGYGGVTPVYEFEGSYYTKITDDLERRLH
jgi:hypothetical protein